MVRVKFKALKDYVEFPEAVAFTYAKRQFTIFDELGRPLKTYPIQTVSNAVSYGPELYRAGIVPRWGDFSNPADR